MGPQSEGLPQYTVVPPLELLELDELLELELELELLELEPEPELELELLVVPLELLVEPLELLELPVSTWHVAERSGLTIQAKPLGHPHTVQSPE